MLIECGKHYGKCISTLEILTLFEYDLVLKGEVINKKLLDNCISF